MNASIHPTKGRIVCSMSHNAAENAQQAIKILHRLTNREDIDDENISVTGRTNSASHSRCSSTYRSRSRSPPHPDEEGVLNLDTKSAKNTASDDSSAFNDVKPKPPSEHQSRLEEAYQSGVEQQSSKAKSKKLSVADDDKPVPQVPPHEENGYEKSLELFINTKAHLSCGARNKVTPFLPRNYLQENSEMLKNHPFIPSVASFPPPFFPNPENLWSYPQLMYRYHTLSNSNPPHSQLSGQFVNSQHPLLFNDSYRKEPLKFTSPTSPSRTSSPPKVGAQPFPGSRVEPLLQTSQSSVTPIH